MKGDAEGAAAAVERSGEAGRLYVKKNAEGEIKEEKFQVTPSDTMLRRGDEEITTHRELAQAVNETAEAERKWRTQLAEAGTDLQKRLQYTKDYVASLRQQREAIPGAYAVSAEVDSIEKRLARGEAVVTATQTKIQAEARSAEEALQRQRSAGLISQTKEEERAIAKRAAAERAAVESLQRQRSAAMIANEKEGQRIAEKEAAHQLENGAGGGGEIERGPEFRRAAGEVLRRREQQRRENEPDDMGTTERVDEGDDWRLRALQCGGGAGGA